MFISSLTESQVIAAVLTFVILFAFYMMNGISSFFSEGAMSTCITFGLLILAAAIIIYTMIKNFLISAVVCVVGEIALAVSYTHLDVYKRQIWSNAMEIIQQLTTFLLK